MQNIQQQQNMLKKVYFLRKIQTLRLKNSLPVEFFGVLFLYEHKLIERVSNLP